MAPDGLVYLDTSAFAKLFTPEPESPALRRHLRGRSFLVSSSLLRTEALRIALRLTQTQVADARRLLRLVAFVHLTHDVLDAGGLLPPSTMRSLDAIHVATALSLGDDLAELVTYDDRMAAAAAGHGIAVASPA